MKTIEIKQIPVRAFTVDGQATCGIDFQKIDVCQFLGTRRMGFTYTCMATGKDLESDGGFLAPSAGCPVWKEEK